jgi:CRISPR-associated protein Csh1
VIYDILDIFKKQYEKSGDELILGNYHLKDGLYFILNEKNSTTKKYIKSSKKQSSKFLHFFSDEDENSAMQESYEWFKKRDYYSNILGTAKAFDAPKKSIHNNNYLSLFMKIEEFLKVDFKHIKNRFFKRVVSFNDFKTKEEKKNLETFCSYISKYSRKKDIVLKLRYLEKHFETIKDSIGEHNPKEYIRLFFDESLENYKQESEIYLALKIYNKNEYSIEVDEEILGLSNDNMGLNSKKPFLEHKSRRLLAPFMITRKSAFMSKLFFDWLALQPYKTDLLEQIFIHRYSNNGLAIISDFDHIPLKNYKLKKIYVQNHLLAKYKGNLLEDYEIEELWQLENIVDEKLYNNQLKHNYLRDDLKVSNYVSKNLHSLIFETRYAMVNYFKKLDDREFYYVIKKYTNEFIMEHIRQNRHIKAIEALNLKLSLKQHKGEEIMNIKNIQIVMLEKIDSSNYDALKAEEFFYISGQVIKYLLNQSKSGKKDSDMLEPFLRAKSVKKLKDEIKFTFFRYKHEIDLNHIRFNNAMSLITAYEGEGTVDSDALLIGLLSRNIFYTKKGESENE